MDRSQQLQEWAMSARLSIADQLLHGQTTTIPDGYTELDISLAHKYNVINLDDIISQNATDPQWDARVLIALDILRRYGKNLLRPAGNRPKEWRIIKFVNPIYVDKVQPLKGSRDILYQLGYILDCEDSFKYPENAEPDMNHVAVLTAEILLAQADLKEFFSGKHIRHDDICCLMPPPLRPISQRPTNAGRSQTQRPASQPVQTVYSTAQGNAAQHGGIHGQTTPNIQWSTPGQGGMPAGGGAPQRVTATQGGTLTQGATTPQGGTPIQHETAQRGTPTPGGTRQQSSTYGQHVLHQTGSTSQGGTLAQGGTTLPGGTPTQWGPILRGTPPQSDTTLPGGTQRGIPSQGRILTQGGTPPHVRPQGGTSMQYQHERGTPLRGDTFTQGGIAAAPGGLTMHDESTRRDFQHQQRSIQGLHEQTMTSSTAQAGIFTQSGPLQQGNTTLQRVTPGPLNINISSDNGPPSTIHPLPPTPQPDDQADVHPLTSPHVSSGAPYQQQPEMYSRENSQLSSSGPMVSTSQQQWFQPHGPMIEKKPPEAQGTAQMQTFPQPFQGAPHNLNQTSPQGGVPAGPANYSDTQSFGTPGYTASNTRDVGMITQKSGNIDSSEQNRAEICNIQTSNVQTSGHGDYQVPPPRIFNAPANRGRQVQQQFAGSHFHGHGPLDLGNTRFPVSSPQDHAEHTPHQSQGMPVTMPDLSTASTGYQQHGPVPQTFGHPGQMPSSGVPYSGPSRIQEMPYTGNENSTQTSYPQRGPEVSAGRAEGPAANTPRTTSAQPNPFDVDDLVKMVKKLEINKSKYPTFTDDNYLCPNTGTREVEAGKTGKGFSPTSGADLYPGEHHYETVDDIKRQTDQTQKHGGGNTTLDKEELVPGTSPQTQKTRMSHDPVSNTESAPSGGGTEQQHAKFKDRPLPPIECPHCRNINPAESTMCLRCETGLLSDRNWPEMPPGQHKTTPTKKDAVTPRDGTQKVTGALWKCDRCRKVNPSDTTECMACNTLKEETVNIPKHSTQDNQMEVAPPDGESVMKAEPTEPGWTCEHCTSRNPYGKKICRVCGKTNDVPLSDPAKAKEQESHEDSLKEKICQKCFALNPQDGATCVSCKCDFSSCTPQWDCEYCTSKNPFGRRICAVCGKTNNVPLMDPNTQHHDKPMERDPVGWTCGHCTTVNKAGVRICSFCNITKGTTPKVQPGQGVTRHEPQRREVQIKEPPGRAREIQAIKCDQCGQLNRLTAEVCRHCRHRLYDNANGPDGAYPEVPPDEGENEGTERTCPHCSFVNLADADLCISCANKLTHERVKEPPGRAREIQAIKCDECGQLNRLTAEVCRHCRQRLYENNANGPDGFQRSDMHHGQSSGVKCGNCTVINPPNTRICTVCGKTINLGTGTTQFDNQPDPQVRPTYGEMKHETTRLCPHCDKPNLKETKECIHCGHLIQKQKTQLLGTERDQMLQAAAGHDQLPQAVGEETNFLFLREIIQKLQELWGQGAQNKRPAIPNPLPTANNEGTDEFQQTNVQKGDRDVDALMTDKVPIGDNSLLQYQEAGIKAGFTVDEVKMALQKADGNDPIEWLKDVWRVKMKEVAAAVEERCFQFDPLRARVVQISGSEIRRALLKTDGDVDEAVKECERARRAMVTDILEFGNFEEAKIHHLLFQKDGDVDATVHALSTEVLEPITTRLYSHQEGDMMLDDQHLLFDSSFVENICNPDRPLESRARMALVMGGMADLWEAMEVVRIIDEIDMNQNVSVHNVIETRKRCDSYQTALDCLQKACLVCNRAFSIDLLWSISSCACMTCRECFVQQYSRMIRPNQAWEFSCPICGLPNLLENKTQTMNFFTELQNRLQHLLMRKDKQNLEGKILDFTLKGKEEFVWCSECERGLFVKDLGNDLKCTKCEHVPQELQAQLKECPLCMDSFMMEKIQTLSHCQCHFCTDCFTKQFKIAIETESPARYTCPNCSEPDLNDTDVAAEYFSFLENKLKHLVTKKEHETLCTKIRDWHLRHDERFMWCSNPQCLSGFLYDGDNKATCPNCQKKTCPRCKEAWEDEHENRTCAEFHIYKEILSAKGALDVLRLNKMYCPGCKAVFILERGGCQHLTCRECNHQFCEGCLQPFGKCERFEDCKLKGLHAHHPRNCSYYLRDERYGIERLTRLLEEHNVEFDKGDAVEDDDIEDVDANNGCPVKIDSENQTKDEKHPCGQPVLENQAGLCTKHYKEYLIKEINRHRLDPVEIMDEAEMIMVIDREHMLRPAQNDRATLIQYVKDNLPIHQQR